MFWMPKAGPAVEASPPATDDFWYREIASQTQAGVYVTEESAIRITAVWTCLLILSDSVAMLPIHLYRRKAGGGTQRADDHRAARLMRKPAPWLTRMEWFQAMQYHAASAGRVYAELRGAGPGRRAVQGMLRPLLPGWVELEQERPSYRLAYKVRDPKEGTYQLDAADCLHYRGGIITNTIEGASPIQEHREALGFSAAASAYGSRFFKNDARPRGVIEAAGQFKDKEARDLFRRTWLEMYGGENQNSIAVLPSGMQYKAMGLSNEDAQFLESARYSAQQIARIWRIPGHMINELGDASYNNVEQLGLGFVTWCLDPWLVRWEQTLGDFLLTEGELEDYYFEFNRSALTRGDIKTRFMAYRQALGGHPFMAPNEVRKAENLDPIDGGEKLPAPLNMSRGPGPQGDDGGDQEPEDDEDEEERRAEREDRAQELIAAELSAIAEIATKADGIGGFMKRARNYYARHCAELSVRNGLEQWAGAYYGEVSLERLRACENLEDVAGVVAEWEATKAETLTELMT